MNDREKYIQSLLDDNIERPEILRLLGVWDAERAQEKKEAEAEEKKVIKKGEEVEVDLGKIDWGAAEEIAGNIDKKHGDNEIPEEEIYDIFSATKPTEPVELPSETTGKQKEAALRLAGSEEAIALEIAEEDPILASEIKAQQKLVEEEGYSVAFPKLASDAKKLKDILVNVDESSAIYKKNMLGELVYESVATGGAWAGEIQGITNRSGGDLGTVESVKSPSEQLDYYMTLDGKPSFMSQDNWDLIQTYKQSGEISKEHTDKIPGRIKAQVIYETKQNEANKYMHASELSKSDRERLVALMSDQLKGNITHDDVMRFRNNPKELNFELEKNSMRSDILQNQLKEITAYEKSLTTDKKYKELNRKAKEYTKSIEEMDIAGINQDSSLAEIRKYNQLITDLQSTQAEFKQAGYARKYDEQAKRIEKYNSERESLMEDSAELTDIAMTLDLASRDYSAINKMGVGLEQFFLGAGSAALGTTAGFIGETGEAIGIPADGLYKFLKKMKGVSIDYNETLRNRLEDDYAKPLKFKDVKFNTIDSYIANTLADGAPSIATVLLTMYGGKLLGPSNAAIANTAVNSQARTLLMAQRMKYANRASKLAQGIFFTTSYGSKGAELEIAQRHAPEQIANLENQLASGNLTPYETDQAKKQLENLDRILELNVLQKAGSQLLAGSIEMYSEKLGSLGYMKNLNKISHAVGAKPFKKIMYKGLNLGINVGIEVVEETAAQIGNNVSDIYILGEDKSIFEGLDADFYANVMLTSLAIQGPSIGSSLYDIISSEARSRNEIIENQNNLERLLEIESSLSNPINLTNDQKLELKGEKMTIMEEAGIANIISLNKLTKLSDDEKIDLFDINRQRRKVLNQFRELGGRGDAGSKSVKNQKQKLISEFKNIDNQRNQLLNQPEVNRRKAHEKSKDPALGAYNQGLYDFYSDVVGVQQVLNGNEMIRVTDETTIEELTERFGKDKAQEIIDGRDAKLVNDKGNLVYDKKGNTINASNNATFIGDDVVIYESNTFRNLQNTANKSEALFAAVSPLHELMHIQNRKAGIVKDGVLVDQANLAVQEAESQLKEKVATGKISQEQYNEFLDRKKLYTTKDGVDMEEVLQIFGDMTAAGILSEYDFSKINSLKYMLKGLVNKYNPGNTAFLFPVKTGNDVFSYIKSFHTAVKEAEAKMAPPEEEKEKGKMSKAASERVQEIYETKGVDGAFEIIEEFKPIVGKIVQRRSEAPNFDRQLLTDEIETGERGILDLIRDYNPDSGVPLAAYINKYLPSRAIEASRRVLGEQFEADITEARGVTEVGVEEDIIEQAEVKPKVKPKKTTRQQLGIQEGSKLFNKVKDAVIKTFGTKLPQISSKEFRAALEKAYRTELKKPLADFFGTRAKYKEFLDKNWKTIYDALPQSIINKRFRQFAEAVVDKEGKQLREKTKQGKKIFTKKDITKKEFVDYFISTDIGASTRGTRKDALAEAVAQELAFDATMEVIQQEDVNKKRQDIAELQNRDILENADAIIANQIRRDPTLKFSKGTLTDQQKDEFAQHSESFIKEFTDSNLGYYGVKNILYKTYINENPSDVWGKTEKEQKEKLDELAKQLKNPVNKYLKNYKEKKAPSNFGKFAMEEIAQSSVATNLKIFLKLKDAIRNFKSLFEVEKYIQDQRSLEVDYSMDLVDKYGQEKAIEISLKYMKGHNTTAGKIGKGRYQIWKGLSDYIDNNLNTIPGVSIIYEITKGKYPKTIIKSIKIHGEETIKDIDITPIQQKSKNKEYFVNEYDKRTEEAKEAWDILIDYLSFMKKNGSTLSFGMTMMSLKSNMASILKAAAPVKYYYVGTKMPASQLRYEHIIPTEYIVLKLTQHFFGNKIDLDALRDKYNVAVIPKIMDKNLDIQLQKVMPSYWNETMSETDRYFSDLMLGFPNMYPIEVIGGKNKGEIIGEGFVKLSKSVTKAAENNTKSLNNSGVLKFSKNTPNSELLDEAGRMDEALNIARDPNAPIKKIRVFDFDDTLARTKSKVIYEMPDGKKGKLTAEQFAERSVELEAEGAKFDFSEFEKVIKGKKGPLLEVAKLIADKRGTDDVFVLTARPPEAAQAIHEFLKSVGLDIPLKNITGLADGSSLAKSQWIVNKAAEGYNDFYFADDHTGNVDAVKKVLDQIDVKSRVQQAKLKFSKGVDKQFNDIIENKTGIEWYKEYSPVKAKTEGSRKGKFKFFIPPSAEDFVGLLYATLGKGKIGDTQMAWYKEHLLDPFARAMENVAKDRIALISDFKELKKALTGIPKNLRKKAFGGYTYENVIRIHVWDKQGMKVPGLSKKDLKDVNDFVAKNPELEMFADQLIAINKGDAYAKPGDAWLAGTITTDLINTLNTTKRSKYLQEWQENADLIFSEKNLNKLEAAFGSNYREAMENMLTRMKTGRNRTSTGGRLENRMLDYINNSVGAVMFFNMRSAVLQTISAVNFLNWKDNNPLKAGKAFANQPQYWSDFMKLMNSDFLVDRRNGLKINVSESEIADAAKTAPNKAKGVISYLLEKGFLPTKFADSFAIASGGATFFRNRVDTYIKEGMSKVDAEAKAFEDFREIAEESQQSARPDRISQQQASGLGRVILAFANTPMQYARLMKKATQDLINGRGDPKSNISKIIYYGAIQNVIFNALQQAVFALAWDDEEEDEKAELKKKEKYFNVANSMLDSILRGTGIGGAALSTVKNLFLDVWDRSGKKRPDYADAAFKLLDFSPPIDIKISKLRQAGNNWEYNKDKIAQMGFDINNPGYLSAALVISAVTNVPVDRLIKKYENVSTALEADQETWKRIAMMLGWPEWQLESPKEQAERREIRKEEKAEFKKEQKTKEIEEELYKGKSQKEVDRLKKSEEVYDLKKDEQVRILKSLGLSKEEIKELKLEEDRVGKILSMRDKDSKKIDEAIKNQATYEPSKEEKEVKKIFDLNKGEQIEILEGYDLSKEDIKALKYEQDRVNKILELQED